MSGVVECVVGIKKSVADPGRGPGAWSSLFLDETEAQRAEKNFLICFAIGEFNPFCVFPCFKVTSDRNFD